MKLLPPVPFQCRRGLTLTELLLVMVVLVALTALAFPAMRGAYEDSRKAACVNNLRNIGLIFHQYAGERNGSVRFLRDGSGVAMWYNELKRYAGLTDEAAQKAFGCPKERWQDVGPWWCYGMRTGYLSVPTTSDPGYPVLRDDDGATYGFRVAAVEKPGRFFLMSDSAVGTSGRQSFRIAERKLYSNSGVILRHRQQANILFLDGHVESLGGSGLKQLDFQQVLDSQHRPLSL